MKKVFFILSGVFVVCSLLAQSPGKIRDIDGNEYLTVKIGKQEWMAENLKTTRSNDGTRLTLITDEMEWVGKFEPAFSWYQNDEGENKNTYGALYNWYAVDAGNLCPKGWHVPSHAEWSVLTSFLGGVEMPGTPILMEGELKSTRTDPDSHPRWNSPNKGGTNKSGFSALPGGHRNFLGPFNYQGLFGFWWTSSAAGDFAYYRGMRYDNSDVFMTSGNKRNGFSVRCIKN